MGDWNDCAGTWDENESVREYSVKAFESLKKYVDTSNNKIETVLDFGCGTGLLTDKLVSSCERIVAIDTSTAMIDVLNKKGYKNVISFADNLSPELINSHDCLTAKFDLIVASSVCSFIPEYEDCVKLLHSIVKPGGCFVQWDWLSEEFSKERVESALVNAGFSSFEISEPFSMEMEGNCMPVVMGVGFVKE